MCGKVESKSLCNVVYGWLCPPIRLRERAPLEERRDVRPGGVGMMKLEAVQSCVACAAVLAESFTKARACHIYMAVEVARHEVDGHPPTGRFLEGPYLHIGLIHTDLVQRRERPVHLRADLQATIVGVQQGQHQHPSGLGLEEREKRFLIPPGGTSRRSGASSRVILHRHTSSMQKTGHTTRSTHTARENPRSVQPTTLATDRRGASAKSCVIFGERCVIIECSDSRPAKRRHANLNSTTPRSTS